jgi:TP901 family phage tail tape measure protein
LIIETGFALNGPWGLLALMAMAVAMLVNRAGASMVFFDVVGRFQAERLIKDADTSMTVFNAVMLDSFANIQDSLNVIGTSFEGLVNEVLPLTEAIADAEIELEKFLLEADQIDEISQEIIDMGVAFGFSGDQALSASAKMAQLASVLGPGMTATGTELGLQFGLISGMETEAAMQRLINLNQQLFFMTEGTENLNSVAEKRNKITNNTIAVMDKLNTIENRSASTMEQITFVMNQFASQAHLTGESLEMMAAQSAVLIETGEEQGKAGRALRMIYARLGADTNGARRELEALNIAVEDSNGNLRPLSEVLGDLSHQWSGLEASERQAVAQSVAGNRHYTRFIKLMNNYDRAVQLSTEANEGLFPAMDEVNKRLEANITEFRAAEAALSNYRAELGDALLPALTDVTEKQATFTKFLADAVAVLGDNRFGNALLMVGLGIKSMVVPMMGVITNIAAMTVAMQTNRAVTRAMAGEQLMLEEAFGRGALQQLRNADSLRQRNQIGQAAVAMMDAELVTLKKLTAEKEADLLLDISAMSFISQIEQAEIRALQGKIRRTSLDKSMKETEMMGLDKTKQKYKDLEAEVKALDQTLAQHRDTLEGLQIENDKTAASVDKMAQAYGGSRVQKGKEENKQIEEENRLRAQQAKELYAVGGAALALGSAFTLLFKDERLVRLGMSLQIVGTTILTAKQLALAASTLIKSAAEAKGITVKKQTNRELLAEIFGLGQNTRAQAINTAAVNTNTAAKRANAAATSAAAGASAGGAAATGAAAGSAAGPFGMLAGAVIATGIAFVALSASAKKAKTDIDDFTSVDGVLDTGTLQMEAFTEAVLDTNKSLDDLALDAFNAEQAVLALKDTTLDAAKSDEAGLRNTERTAEQAYLARIAQSADMRTNLEADVQAVLDAQAALDYRDSGAAPDPFSGVGGGIGTEGTFFTQHAIREAELLIAEEEHLIKLMESIGEDGVGAIVKAIRANAEFVNQLEKDSLDATTSIAGVMETATQAVTEFNNAREELFFGMAASNVTGDLVRQVVNRGVEHLLVNTEVVMTNNFNGMTTEQAAQEILDHVERGARMRGVDMSTVSQSI